MPTSAETKPVTPYSYEDPRLTYLGALQNGVRAVLTDATPGIALSLASQTGLLQLGQFVDHAFDPTVSPPIALGLAKNFLNASPFSWGNHDIPSNISINAADTAGFIVGSWIGAKAIEAKMDPKVNRQPQHALLFHLWKASIMTEFASLGIAGTKTLTQLENIINYSLNLMNSHPEFTLGGILATGGGLISMVDNTRPKKDATVSKEEIVMPGAGMALSILGFFLCPPELKPIAAGYVVAAIANFIEKTTELNRPGGNK